MSTWEFIFQALIDGLVSGSFYALVALGYSMVYGVIKMLNFAHGDIYMTGAFSCFLVFGFVSDALPGWFGVAVSILAAMVFASVLGYLTQRLAYKPLLGAPRLSLLITAIGVSLVISNAVMSMTKGKAEFFSDGPDAAAGIKSGAITISYVNIIILAVSVALMCGLTLFIKRTKAGKAMRAIALDKDASRLMGINVNRIIALTFVLGSSLAAVAGGLYCVKAGKIEYSMGYSIGIKAFSAAVIGGIGSIPGAMLGGLLLGILESLGTAIPGVGSEWKDAFAFGALILILILKPNGLLGKTEVERM